MNVLRFDSPSAWVNGVTAWWRDRLCNNPRLKMCLPTGLTPNAIYADLFMGNSALTYSEKGYGYAMEKAASTQGWTFTMFEEAFNQGYPQELSHFIECVREDREPVVTGEDGRAALELICGAYQSARTGQKTLLPFNPPAVARPIDLWLGDTA